MPTLQWYPNHISVAHCLRHGWISVLESNNWISILLFDQECLRLTLNTLETRLFRWNYKSARTLRCETIHHDLMAYWLSLHWRHNGRTGVSNHLPNDCLLNRVFRHRSKKTSKLRVTGLCEGNSPGTGEFPAQMAGNAENVSIWWRHRVCKYQACHPIVKWTTSGKILPYCYYRMQFLVGVGNWGDIGHPNNRCLNKTLTS